MKIELSQERQLSDPVLLFQISQYYGHWAEDHPDVSEGRCVKSVVTGDESESDSSEQGCNSIDIYDLGWGLVSSFGTDWELQALTCSKTPNMIRDRFGDIPKMSIELQPRSRNGTTP